MVNCTFCYASLRNDDTQSIKSMRVRVTVMHDCMQLKNLKKGQDEKDLKSKWAAKAGVVLVLMRIKFNNHNSGCKILIKLLIFCGLNCDY